MRIKRIMLVTFSVLYILSAKSQQYAIDDINQSVFLYPDFYQGKVLLKNKSVQPAIFNYNTSFQQMIYVQNGVMLALDNVTAIDTVYINEAAFVPVDTFFCEVRLPHNRFPLFIKYQTEITPSAPATPFGGNSQTGAVQNISSYRWSAATPYQLKVPENYNIRKFASYYIKTGLQLIEVKNAKQIRQLFPANEKQISQFMKEHHTNFEKTVDMEKLVALIGTLSN